MDSILTLLEKYNLHPRKGLGQNFLIDPIHLARIVEIAELTQAETVLEIGPGPGGLTRLLAEAAGQVIAVELDPNMVHLLRHELGRLPHLTIIEADILQIQIEQLFLPSRFAPLHTHHPHEASTQSVQPSALPAFQSSPPYPPREASIPYKVVANLPYYITSAVIRRLLEATPPPERLVVTVQKEVAQRMVAKPGQMSLLAVSVQFYGRPALVHRIPAGAFYPAPQVDSAVVRIDTFTEPPIAVTNIDYFFRVVKAGFGQKRKQLKNSLAAGLHKSTAEVSVAMTKVEIDPTRRAETLSLEEWGRLVEVLRPVRF